MKVFLIFVIINTHFNLVYGQDEGKIYELIIKDYILKLRQPNIDYSDLITITILDRPFYMRNLGINDSSFFKNNYKNFNNQTLIDFIDNNNKLLNLFDINIINVELVIINRDSIPKWKEFISKYPKWIFSIIELSHIGFNNDKNQALVYYAFDSGHGVGGGSYFIFEKIRRKWVIKKVIPSWAA